jgi:hypothetical protein
MCISQPEQRCPYTRVHNRKFEFLPKSTLGGIVVGVITGILIALIIGLGRLEGVYENPVINVSIMMGRLLAMALLLFLFSFMIADLLRQTKLINENRDVIWQRYTLAEIPLMTQVDCTMSEVVLPPIKTNIPRLPYSVLALNSGYSGQIAPHDYIGDAIRLCAYALIGLYYHGVLAILSAEHYSMFARGALSQSSTRLLVTVKQLEEETPILGTLERKLYSTLSRHVGPMRLYDLVRMISSDRGGEPVGAIVSSVVANARELGLFEAVGNTSLLGIVPVGMAPNISALVLPKFKTEKAIANEVWASVAHEQKVLADTITKEIRKAIESQQDSAD